MPKLRTRYRGPKEQAVKGITKSEDSPSRNDDANRQVRALVKSESRTLAASPTGLSTRQEVGTVMRKLLSQCHMSDAASALIPWFCDALPSEKSRQDYFRDLSTFFREMLELGVHPYDVSGDHVRLYKEALQQSGKRPGTTARALSVIRGAYEQFGKKGLIEWNIVGDIQAVSAPRVEKNTTPMIGEADACKMLHAPAIDTLIGCRDHALLFTYFKTACRSSAIASAKVSDLERSDTDWFLRVTEKGGKERRLPLLEAAPAVLSWVERAEIGFEGKGYPLFPAMGVDKRTVTNRYLSSRQVLNVVKKYAKMVGLNVSPGTRRGICTHSLRKTAAVNALRHGAQVHQVQQWLGHADIRTTQEYITYHEEDVEEAARRCQIR